MHEHSVHLLLQEREKIFSRDLVTTAERDNTRRNNFIIVETAILISLLPPCVVSSFLISYLAINMNMTTLKFKLDKNLIGVTGQNYQGWDCHFGIHPYSVLKDIHLSCSNGSAFSTHTPGQSYYQSLIQNFP